MGPVQTLNLLQRNAVQTAVIWSQSLHTIAMADRTVAYHGRVPWWTKPPSAEGGDARTNQLRNSKAHRSVGGVREGDSKWIESAFSGWRNPSCTVLVKRGET